MFLAIKKISRKAITKIMEIINGLQISIFVSISIKLIPLFSIGHFRFFTNAFFTIFMEEHFMMCISRSVYVERSLFIQTKSKEIFKVILEILQKNIISLSARWKLVLHILHLWVLHIASAVLQIFLSLNSQKCLSRMFSSVNASAVGSIS